LIDSQLDGRNFIHQSDTFPSLKAHTHLIKWQTPVLFLERLQ